MSSSAATAAAAGGSSYSARSGLSKSWRTVKSHAGVYTGGKVELFQHNGASLIACMLHDDVAILDATTGELKRTLQQDVEDVRLAITSAVGILATTHTTLSVFLVCMLARQRLRLLSLRVRACPRRSRKSRSWSLRCVQGTTSS